MGKEGPCYHCGVTSTLLWRNGPPEKPVLCNACGSRWRTKGTLANYTPLHARVEPDEYEDGRVSKVKTKSLTTRDEKPNKRRLSYENSFVGRYASDYKHGFQSMDEDASNRSSSGSAISNSESCAQFSADASDHTGSAESIVWETQVPSKKRTCVSRPKPSPVEKLTQDLCAILHEQQSSNLSGSSEDDLLFESDTPMVSVEIGHGSVLIKHPSSLAREEESEASSLSCENKTCAFNEAYSHSAPLFGCKGDNARFHGSENLMNCSGSQMMHQDSTGRDKLVHKKMQLLWSHNSPLCRIDLSDVLNFEVLSGHLTSEEQQQLFKFLPSSDSSQFPASLRSMFDSSSFKEKISLFQQLLSEGVFSNSCSGVKTEDFKILERLELQDNKSICNSGNRLPTLGSSSSLSKSLGSAKRPHDELNQNQLGTRVKLKSLKRAVMKSVPSEEILNCNLFPLSHQFADERADHALLLDIPSNPFFPEAEILPISSFSSHQTTAKSSSLNLAMIPP